MIKLKLRERTGGPLVHPVDEAAKWRSTSFDTEFTEEEMNRLISKYGDDALGAHYDDGVPTGKQTSMIGAGDVQPRSREMTEPQTSFNPRGQWETPTGIYYYPLSWAKDQIFRSGIPFMAKTKYIYIYRIRDLNKRIDAVELADDGFIENALFWASKNSDVRKILTDSGITGKAYTEILSLYGDGGVSYGDPSKSVEENIYNAYRTYLLDFKQQAIDDLVKLAVASKTQKGGFDPDDLYANYIFFLTRTAFSGLRPKGYFSVRNESLPSYPSARAEWEAAAKRVINELSIRKFLLELKDLPPDHPQVQEIFNGMRYVLQNYIEGTREDQVLKKTQLPSTVDKPAPPDSIKKIFSSNGFNTDKIANVCFYIINNMLDRNVARVSKYFISQGYEVFEDREGTKTIHPSEPYQGVYMTTRVIELVGVYLNRDRRGRKKPPTVGSKEIDPAMLRQMLRGDQGQKFVNQALKYAKKDPKELDMFLQHIFTNPDITKDKALADKIANESDPDHVYVWTIGRYINSFTYVLTPDELEKNLSKLVSDKTKKAAEQSVYSDPGKVSAALVEKIEDLEAEYGSKFDINDYPTLKYLKDVTLKADKHNKIHEFLFNSDRYDIDEIKEFFPTMLEEELPSGKTIDFETVVTNLIEATSFKERPFEERADFIKWLFNNYPQAWEDDKIINSALRCLRYMSREVVTPTDIEKYREMLKANPVYTALFKYLDDKEWSKEKGANPQSTKAVIPKSIGESRFKKLNRIGRYSNF